jgi:hypothetical protein
MKELILDSAHLIKKHWRSIIFMTIFIYLLFAYADIKQGVIHGWAGQ